MQRRFKTDDLRIGWMGATEVPDRSSYQKGTEVVAVWTYVLIVRIYEEFDASGFVQTQNGLVNGLSVWHWILFYTDWSLLNIYLFGGGEFILLLNALLWDVRAQRLYIDRNQSYGVDSLCGMPRCWDQGFCCKAKSCVWWSKHDLCGLALCITWIREPHTSVWVKNGIRTQGVHDISF